MSVINRRNAVMGWAVWNVMKRAGRRKARKATPSVEGSKRNKSLIAAGVAATAGAFAVILGRRVTTD